MKLSIGMLAIILLVSCQKKSDKNFEQLEKMNWLIGNWENKMPEGLLRETWKKENDSVFTGNSFFITEKDTVHFESIKMYQKGDSILYSATVVGQNNDEPVEFNQTTATETEFIFENPKHDYPQKIVYKKVNDTNLVATISGIQQGKKSSESYPMQKK
jgi:Domain of unknown function (DUF6265)